MAKTTVGVIGLGLAVAPHARSLTDLRDRVSVKYAFTRTPERREAFAEQYPSFQMIDDLETILNDPEVRAVWLLTPPNTHLELVRRAAAAGKHVLLEKPVEVTTERAEELVRIARRAGITLAVNLQHRFRLGSLQLYELLAQGALGRVANASAYMRLWRSQGYYDEPGRGTIERDGGGVLMTQGIHTLDLLLSLAGPAEQVTAFAATTPIHRMEAEDLVAAAIRFESGAIGTIDATTACYPGFVERIELIGERGTAVLQGAELRVHFQDGRELAAGAEEVVQGGGDPMAFPHDFHRRLHEDFLDAIRTGGEPRIAGEEALKVHRLIDAILRSAAERRIVTVRGG